jgi:uncharacterized protein (DUF58 family)
MISPEIHKKVELIRIFTREKVTSSFAGNYLSAFKGSGIEFEGVREYEPGDDIRTIDWNVTARTGKPHIKKYQEERELTILFAVDCSASGDFSSTERTKRDTAAEIVSVLALAAAKNSDRTSLLLFSDEIEEFIPPSKGVEHNYRLVSRLLSFKPRNKGTSINKAFEYISRVAGKHWIVFFLSDFCDEGWQDKIKVMSSSYDFVAVDVVDPLESEFPDAGLVTVTDSETGKSAVIDTRSHSLKHKSIETEKLIRRSGAGFIRVNTDKDWIHSFIEFFHKRELQRSGSL